MPFESTAQEGYLQANDPQVAKQFAAQTSPAQQAALPVYAHNNPGPTQARRIAAMKKLLASETPPQPKEGNK